MIRFLFLFMFATLNLFGHDIYDGPDNSANEPKGGYNRDYDYGNDQGRDILSYQDIPHYRYYPHLNQWVWYDGYGGERGTIGPPDRDK